MAQDEKVFADGFSFKRRENAPDFVVGRVSVKCDDAVSFMKQNQKNGWLNLNINQAKSGKYYIELDTFEPKKKTESAPPQEEEADLPF
tara:strand:- start:473 stop:736 length:264 start_codon:yes stop_codon:yes gene_type:complete